MSDGYKTYWRHPGTDGGIPPELDWSGSTNVKAVKVGFPTPKRYVGEYGYAIGYKDTLILPVVAEPLNESQPMTLRRGLFYGVCKEICIPAEAGLSAVINPRGDRGAFFGRPTSSGASGGASSSSGPDAIAAARLIDAVYAVPKPITADGGLPRVVTSRVETKAGKATVWVEVDFGADASGTDLFAEAPR